MKWKKTRKKGLFIIIIIKYITNQQHNQPNKNLKTKKIATNLGISHLTFVKVTWNNKINYFIFFKFVHVPFFQNFKALLSDQLTIHYVSYMYYIPVRLLIFLYRRFFLLWIGFRLEIHQSQSQSILHPEQEWILFWMQKCNYGRTFYFVSFHFMIFEKSRLLMKKKIILKNLKYSFE